MDSWGEVRLRGATIGDAINAYTFSGLIYPAPVYVAIVGAIAVNLSIPRLRLYQIRAGMPGAAHLPIS
jgi:hypothetical protein